MLKNETMKEHWNELYEWMDTEELGWYEEFPEPSLNLLSSCNIDKNDPILDVGTGSSTFIDNLINHGFKNIIATDISNIGIDKSKKRLGEKASLVKWIIDDITNPMYLKDLEEISVWHDRALLHFLLKEEDQRKYLDLLKKVVKKDGYVIIAVFSLKGIKKCAGLDVKNYDQKMLMELLGNDFKLLESFDYIYHAPSGAERPYVYTLFQRVAK